jgi:hypothetical protein
LPATDYIEAAPDSDLVGNTAGDTARDQVTEPPANAAIGSGKLGQAMLVADIAVEADYEYFANTFKGDLVRATDYVTELLTAVSDIYERDLQIRLRPSFIRIATQQGDPWSAKDSNSELLEVKDFWTTYETARSRAAVLFLSGRSLGGGLAYRSGLCSKDFGYAVVSSVRGSFTVTPGDNTWDLVSVAHELGHVFGSKHSHCYKREDGPSGWYDQCYSAQESSGCYSGPVQATNGTLMSYCYVAGGSMSRIDPLSFSDGDPVMISVMRRTAEVRLIDSSGGCMDFANGQMPLAGHK